MVANLSPDRCRTGCGLLLPIGADCGPDRTRVFRPVQSGPLSGWGRGGEKSEGVGSLDTHPTYAEIFFRLKWIPDGLKLRIGDRSAVAGDYLAQSKKTATNTYRINVLRIVRRRPWRFSEVSPCRWRSAGFSTEFFPARSARYSTQKGSIMPDLLEHVQVRCLVPASEAVGQKCASTSVVHPAHYHTRNRSFIDRVLRTVERPQLGQSRHFWPGR